MDAHDLNARLQAKATHVANYLNALTPYERALVLHQAELLWAERRRGPDPADEEDDARLIVGQWLSNAVQRMSQKDADLVIELVTQLQQQDDRSRLERLTDGLDI